MQIAEKVFVVTGGGNGIGRELVLNLLNRGARVAAADINEPGLEETVNLSGSTRDRLSTHIVNITQKSSVEALPEQIISKHGNIDGIINNAGIIQPFVRLKDLGYDVIDRVMQVNYYGTLYMVKTFLPYLLKRPEAHITNVSSMGSLVPVPGQSVYGASKAAVNLFTKALHSELRETKVGVTLAIPGAIGTNILENSGVSRPEMPENSKNSSIKPLPPEKAAEMIINAMVNNKSRVLVGNDAKFVDLFYRFSPNRAASFIYKRMRSLLPE